MRTHTGRATQKRTECPGCGKKGVGPFYTNVDVVPGFRYRACRYCTWTQRQDYIIDPNSWSCEGSWTNQVSNTE